MPRPDRIARSIDLEAGETVAVLGVGGGTEGTVLVEGVKIGLGRIEPVDLHGGPAQEDKFTHPLDVFYGGLTVAPIKCITDLGPGEGVAAGHRAVVGLFLPVFVIALLGGGTDIVVVGGLGHIGRLRPIGGAGPVGGGIGGIGLDIGILRGAEDMVVVGENGIFHDRRVGVVVLHPQAAFQQPHHVGAGGVVFLEKLRGLVARRYPVGAFRGLAVNRVAGLIDVIAAHVGALAQGPDDEVVLPVAVAAVVFHAEGGIGGGITGDGDDLPGFRGGGGGNPTRGAVGMLAGQGDGPLEVRAQIRGPDRTR